MARAQILFCSLLILGFAPEGLAQGPSSPGCDAVAKAPEKFVGKTVSFFGSMTSSASRPIGGKQDSVHTWQCKSKDGMDIPGGTFSFLLSEAAWSEAAGKVNVGKTLLHIEGTVRDSKTLPDGATPASPLFLGRIKVQLATEVK